MRKSILFLLIMCGAANAGETMKVMGNEPPMDKQVLTYIDPRGKNHICLADKFPWRCVDNGPNGEIVPAPCMCWGSW